MRQRLAILGSTGSIGEQTLDIVRENPERFEARVLTARSRWERLAEQAREFDADAVAIADERHYAPLRDALAGTDTKVYAGEEAVAQLAAAGDTEVVVNALVGYAGLAPTVAAIGAGKKLALANKEFARGGRRPRDARWHGNTARRSSRSTRSTRPYSSVSRANAPRCRG